MARAKLKSHRGAAKRFKRTGRGKFVSNPAGRRHLLTCKNRRRKRALRRRNTVVSSVDQRALRRLLPYS